MSGDLTRGPYFSVRVVGLEGTHWRDLPEGTPGRVAAFIADGLRDGWPDEVFTVTVRGGIGGIVDVTAVQMRPGRRAVRLLYDWEELCSARWPDRLYRAMEHGEVVRARLRYLRNLHGGAADADA